jgi:hypothetical protein
MRVKANDDGGNANDYQIEFAHYDEIATNECAVIASVRCGDKRYAVEVRIPDADVNVRYGYADRAAKYQALAALLHALETGPAMFEVPPGNRPRSITFTWSAFTSRGDAQ